MATLAGAEPTQSPTGNRRVRRKPAPSVDDFDVVLSRNVAQRYPLPDPTDPFAPLSVLRDRSSAGFEPYRTPSTFISQCSPVAEDFCMPLVLPGKLVQRENHYRTRSQSMVPSASNSDSSHSSIPSLIHDSGGGGSSDSSDEKTGTQTSPVTKPSRRGSVRVLRKRSRTQGDGTLPNRALTRKASWMTSTLPPVPPTPRGRLLHSHGSLDARNFPLHAEADEQGYTSGPDTMPSRTTNTVYPPTPMNRARSNLATTSIIPDSKASSYIDVHIPLSHEPFSGDEVSPQPGDPEWAIPTNGQVAKAASLNLIAPSGLRIAFGSIFEKKRAVVIFLRHFWCQHCQDYMAALASLVPPDANIILISNGSPALVEKYTQMFGVQFPMYVDPDMRIYRALHMGVVTDNVNGDSRRGSQREEGGYVRQGPILGLARVVLRALRVGMPVWEKGGDVRQLGGEFVLGPGMKCDWAHRMQGPRGHAPVPTVLEAAGIGIMASAVRSGKAQIANGSVYKRGDSKNTATTEVACTERSSPSFDPADVTYSNAVVL
ncbi:hypothetical protein CYLTODRAFT_439655 [Cylindrobasidium torrendii FP15055 ss-10]|uniref:Thioredoxin domain-containing protein n=1 Tax=Cylindrobasidium torrendii FP15055 ss-10 TaxID=1314674 RepID=A0A0D7BTT3_9AGAR|nr:hypothetical protein CYLTODRAFT_439655 [Cylindrobasidium torrendii FP15055 ss-10]